MADQPQLGLDRTFDRRHALKAAGLGIASLGLPGLLAACGGSSGGSSAAAGSSGGPLTTLNYQLEWLKISQFNGFFAAQDQGYYTKQGIKANITSGGPNISAAQLVGATKADLGDDDNITLLQAIDKGLPLVMIASIFQKTPYSCISKSSKPIHTLQDMVGKKVAISPAGRAQLTPALQSAGVDPKKVTIVPAGADPTQLVTGQVDGYFGFATDQGVQLQKKGLDVVFASASDLGFGGYADVLFTTKDNLTSKKDALVKFVRATAMGYEYAANNPAAMAKLTVDKYGPAGLDLASETATSTAQVSWIASPKGVLWLDPDKMKQIIDQQVQIKGISKPLNVDDVMTTSILEAAYGGKTSLLT